MAPHWESWMKKAISQAEVFAALGVCHLQRRGTTRTRSGIGRCWNLRTDNKIYPELENLFAGFTILKDMLIISLEHLISKMQENGLDPM